MKATSKSHLTASRKKPVRRARRQPQRNSAWLATLDALDERCLRIATMAGLLRACGDPEEMNVRLAASTGAFMADDLREVKALLAELGRGMP